MPKPSYMPITMRCLPIKLMDDDGYSAARARSPALSWAQILFLQPIDDPLIRDTARYIPRIPEVAHGDGNLETQVPELQKALQSTHYEQHPDHGFVRIAALPALLEKARRSRRPRRLCRGT